MSAPDFTTIGFKPVSAPMDYQTWAAKVKHETGLTPEELAWLDLQRDTR